MFAELKTLAKHSSVYGVAEILKKGIGFLMIPIYTRYLTPADYGLLELLDLTLEVVGMILGLRLGSAVTRYYHYFDEQRDKHEVFATALIFTCISSLVLLAVMQLFGTRISLLVAGNSSYVGCFRIIFVCLAIQNIYLVAETYLITQKKSVLYSGLSVTTLISSLSFNILFLVVFEMGVYGILFSMLIVKSLNMIVSVPISLKGVRIGFSWSKLMSMMRFSFPLIPASLGMFVMHFSDRFFIRQYCTLDELGLYSLGYKFGMILSTLISVPIFRTWGTQQFEIAKQKDAKQIFGQMFTYYSMLMIVSALGISVFIDDIIRIMVSSSFEGSAIVVPIILLSYVLYGMGTFLSLGITITARTKYTAYIQISSAVVNMILNQFLISRFGIVGAAGATALSFGYLALSTLLISQKLYHVPFEYGRIIILFAVAGIVYMASRMIHMPIILSIGMKSLLMLIFPLILILIRFFTQDELKKTREISEMFFSNISKRPSARKS